jgi:hypothetical protein
MNNPLKIKVKYWFEYLRLAHLSNNPEVAKNLENKLIYKDWGDYLNTPFDTWWKNHSHLFRQMSQIKRLTSTDMGSDDSFCLQVPFKYASTTAAKIFKEMYEREFESRRTEKKKLKKVYSGSFELTVDDLKVDRFRYYLHYTKNVYLPLINSGIKPKTGTFITKAEQVFKSVKKLKKSSEESTIPFQTSSDVYENQSRNARRYNIYSLNLLLNVSKGIFPGNYEQAKTLDNPPKKPTIYKERKFTKGVPRSKNENYKKRKSGYDMFATRVKKLVSTSNSK